jgi:general stress protein YciG
MILAIKSAQRRKMTRQEAGRKGGEKVARERGPEFYRQIGKKGGEKVAEERGSEFYREIGRKGGANRGNRTVGTTGGSNLQSRSMDNRRNKKVNLNA